MVKYINSRTRISEVDARRRAQPDYPMNVIENFDEYVRNNEPLPHVMLQFYSEAYKRVWRRFYVFDSTFTTDEHYEQLDKLVKQVGKEIREELVNDGECGNADATLQHVVWHLSKDKFDKLVVEYHELSGDCLTKYYRFYLNAPTYDTLTYMDVLVSIRKSKGDWWRQIRDWKYESKYLMSAWVEAHKADATFKDCVELCDVSYEEISEAQFLYNFYDKKGERNLLSQNVAADELDYWRKEVENYKEQYNVV